MVSGMLRAGENRKVFPAVINGVSIDVMDMFSSQKFASDFLLHQVSVLVHPSTPWANLDCHVDPPSRVMATLRSERSSTRMVHALKSWVGLAFAWIWLAMLSHAISIAPNSELIYCQ